MNRRDLFKGALGVTAAVALPSVAIAATKEASDPDRLVTITTYTKAQWAGPGSRDHGKVLGEARIFKKQNGKFLLDKYLTFHHHDRDVVIAQLSKKAKLGEYRTAFTNK